MIALNPASLTLNVTSYIDMNTNQAVSPSQGVASEDVKAFTVANESPYALLIQHHSIVQWVLPWTIDLIPGDTTTCTILPQVLPGGSALPATPQSSAAVIAVYTQTDAIPSTSFPVALSRQVGVGNLLTVSTQATFWGFPATASGNTGVNIAVVPQANLTTYVTGFSFSAQRSNTNPADFSLTVSGIGGAYLYNLSSTTTQACWYAEQFTPAIPTTSTAHFIVDASTSANSYTINAHGYYAP